MGIWLKCKECGYDFNVHHAYKKMNSTWCRRCGQNVPIIDPEKDEKVCGELYICIGIIIGLLICFLWL